MEPHRSCKLSSLLRLERTSSMPPSAASGKQERISSPIQASGCPIVSATSSPSKAISKSRYLDSGRFPGTQVLVYRRGKIVHSTVQGFADLERKAPVKDDTILPHLFR